MRVRRRLLVAAAAVALIAPAARPAAPALTAASAARFTARTITGERFDLAAALAIGPVLVDFWATWCHPCLESLPALEKLRAQYAAQGLSVVAISIDGPRNFARVRPFAQRLGLKMPVVIDEDGALAQKFLVSSVPTTILIAPDGRIMRTRTGYLPGEDDALAGAVRALLAPAAADSAR
jgi:cytochrome c biogenesis protein CcmG/thiol:disulfide interchange protein DsbE